MTALPGVMPLGPDLVSLTIPILMKANFDSSNRAIESVTVNENA